MNKYEFYLKNVLKKPLVKMTRSEDVITRIYIEFLDKVKKKEVLMVGFMDIEFLIDELGLLKEDKE